jgi:hypothetical protein
LEGVTAASPTETLIRNLAIAFSNLQPLRLRVGGIHCPICPTVTRTLAAQASPGRAKIEICSPAHPTNDEAMTLVLRGVPNKSSKRLRREHLALCRNQLRYILQTRILGCLASSVRFKRGGKAVSFHRVHYK